MLPILPRMPNSLYRSGDKKASILEIQKLHKSLGVLHKALWIVEFVVLCRFSAYVLSMLTGNLQEKFNNWIYHSFMISIIPYSLFMFYHLF